MATTLEIQRRLAELGFQPGPLDGVPGPKTAEAIKQFQRARGLAADGIVGPITSAALFGTTPPQDAAPSGIVPADWMPAAKMQRIIVHWTAGAHKASGLDRSHYHIMIEDDGKLVRGTPSIDLNQAPTRKGYAAHTLNCNSGSVGVSLCCMASAVENPFAVGSAPMTRKQWGTLPKVLAALCKRYGIVVTPKTVLSHAEVQGTLGIAQRGKWDISRLAFDPTVLGATACGDLFRAATKALL
ncbi:peptidoglycan-binding protein [Mesorhizobium sp. SP-1A]|uniref:peptidoglycan recognition protein family protein n=1 Tax=Mesorhizobium sp. SP-1A TaxID=3077840 RepID=UPI0028F725CF|nr:peptidoglycan-binding protein [Mesorhizobium sp. SP-1A]